ncbi:Ig-like domain-containing protein [Clostridium hydrogenum]|uniref:Ig-like domain-containing protein n=1 Tax=Clostridium hydrogenum TaxID=2855764 RepID=UPI001F3F6F7F|nr:Ig-like domain-containing protein [Clostridium hydrogenum]
MNRKKVFSVILASLFISNVFTESTVLAVDTSNNQSINSSINESSKDDTSKVPDDGTPLILGVNNNSSSSKPVKPIIKIKNSLLDKNCIGNDNLVHATLNNKPYNLKFISKDNDIVTLEGDTISENTPKNQKNTLIVYSPDTVYIYSPSYTKSTKVQFSIDSVPPAISFNEAYGRNIENGGVYTGSISPIINMSDNYHLANYSVTLNGKACNGYFYLNTNGGISFAGNKISQDGNYTLKVTAKDDAGNASTFSKSFVIDNTAPNISISGVKDGDYLNSESVTPYIDIQDSNFDPTRTSFVVKKDGVEIPVDVTRDDNGLYYFSLYDEGTYTITATAYDKAGNESTLTPISFVIDRTAPVLNFNFSDNQYFNKAFKPIITTENSDDFVDTLIINGVEYSPDNVPDFLANNAYDVTAIAKDRAGNFSPTSHLKFTIDTIAPVINTSNITDNYYYNTSVSPLITSTDINPYLFTMTLNGTSYNNGIISAEGNYELVITSVDKASNSSEKIIRFVIDKTAPTISLKGLVNNGIFNHSIDPYVYINDPNSYMSILMIDGEDYHGGIIGMDGKHTLLIEAVDKAGNINKEAINFFIKATPPQIYVSGLNNGNTYTGSVTPKISFSKDIVESETTMTLDGNAYKLNDKISSVGNHELVISTTDSAGNKATKRIDFSIASDKKNVTAQISNIIKKIIPTSKSQNGAFPLYGAIAVIACAAIGLLGVLKFKRKKPNK